ncbi:hypothetical protein VIBHAR_06443 [Vibrio campbellii ATCC BAA-1116]|uniref:Uncharacterized protein n=1 Tax=Vibrio campbellii (strain ATCC BAA-1116) TaxID=2902295 RepID=A7N877_VIBC1|nr:hypothetical protein VIBHAR_06443 [Vibrio campbellii ATCC BAA-1116]
MSFSHFKSPHGQRLDLILRARRLECGFYGALTVNRLESRFQITFCMPKRQRPTLSAVGVLQYLGQFRAYCF